MNNTLEDLDYEDRKYMEHSTFATFIDDSQAAILRQLWWNRERGDNLAFYHNHVRRPGENNSSGNRPGNGGVGNI